MAQKDGIIRNLEHVIEEKEREIEMLRENIHNINNSPSVSAEKFSAVETRMLDLEGIVKGLTAELLDIRAEIRKVGQIVEDSEKRPVMRVKKSVKSPRDYPVVGQERRPAGKPAEEAVKVEKPIKRPGMVGAEAKNDAEEVLIIQPDGTLKPEARYKDEDMIVAGNRPVRMSVQKIRNPESQEKKSKPLIYAEDEDTIEIKKRK